MTVLSSMKRIARVFGIDIRRLHNASDHTLLGLRGSGISTVIDVGANSGQFAREALSSFPTANLHCFEPLPTPFGLLMEWASSRQERSRIFVYQSAVGDRCDVVEMFEHLDHSPSSSLLERTEIAASIFPQTRRCARQLVPMTTLDHWISSETSPLEGPILLKIDVQGYEMHVLRGASNLLKIVNHCILEVSMPQLYKDQATFTEIAGLLSTANLLCAGNISQVHALDGSVLYIDALFNRPRAH